MGEYGLPLYGAGPSYTASDIYGSNTGNMGMPATEPLGVKANAATAMPANKWGIVSLVLLIIAVLVAVRILGELAE